MQFTHEQRAWATDSNKLKEQVGLSLKARTIAFNEEFDSNVSIRKFRSIYQEEGVS